MDTHTLIEQEAEVWVRAVKKAEEKIKAEEEETKRKANRTPNVFTNPNLLSDELATFLGKPSGTKMSRIEVTREINEYIRTNQLQDKTNGRIINADAKLSSLLKLNAGDELTYFNLQRYMSPHYVCRNEFTRQPTGFCQPILISDELATFLGKTSGTKMKRTEVTREIITYIKTNNLIKDKTKGRGINADAKLSSLLKLKSGDELTCFNLQRYMSPHFVHPNV